MSLKIPGLKHANITIQGDLHKLAKRRARELGLKDGFSGLVARLLKLELKRKRKRLGKLARLLNAA